MFYGCIRYTFGGWGINPEAPTRISHECLVSEKPWQPGRSLRDPVKNGPARFALHAEAGGAISMIDSLFFGGRTANGTGPISGDQVYGQGWIRLKGDRSL